MEFNVLVMQEERSKKLIRQFYLSKETSPKMVCSPRATRTKLEKTRKYSNAGKNTLSNCFSCFVLLNSTLKCNFTQIAKAHQKFSLKLRNN